MKHLSTVARIITPLAMVVFLAYEINRSMTVTGAWAVALLIGAIGTAVGIEIVGILAGHALEGFWRIGDQYRAALSFILLIAYTGTAVYILRNNSAMVLVPVIAAIVYLLASLTTSLEMTVSQHEAITAVSSAFDLEQAKADRALERELRRQKQADETALKLARVEAKAKNSQAGSLNSLNGSQGSHSTKAVATKLYECSCGNVYENSRAYNGHTRHCAIHKGEKLNGKVKEAS